MRVRQEIRFWIGVLIAMQLLMAVACVQLFSRMGPAIEVIVKENVFSMGAVEEMLAALSRSADPGAAYLFGAAFDRARNNITEPEETPALDDIDRLRTAAFSGDPVARNAMVDALQRLGDVNRRSMIRGDALAQRLGRAGAWGSILMGTAAFLISLIAVRRLTLRLMRPLEEIHDALLRFQEGDLFRRCNLKDAPPEFRDAGAVVNALLEERWSRDKEREREARNLDRLALIALLDERESPAALLGAGGEIRAANQAMTRRIDAPDGGEIRTALRDAVLEGPSPGVQLHPLGKGGFLCALVR